MSKSVQLVLMLLALVLLNPTITQGDDHEEANEPITPEEPILLFNGKDMDGWLFNLADDPSGSYKIDDGILTLTGQPTGELRTKSSYTDYKLTLEWRWPGEEGGNSGLLMHCGEMKQPGKWPKCLEPQLRAGDAGDLVGIGGFKFRVEGEEQASGGYKKNHSDDAEKPIGQWNTMTIRCDGDHVVIHVNGEKVHEAWDCEVDHGPIGLQSEGTAIQIRTLKVEPLEK